jgi:anti-sigma regulatory factor (Ser/Thr protein kinase)
MAGIVIQVPNAAAVRQASSFLSGPDWRLNGETRNISFHPGYCHMQPWALAAIAAWALEFRKTGGEIRVENAERAQYGWRLGLADYLGIDNPMQVTEHEESGRFVPLRTIKTSDDLAELLASLAALLHLSSKPEIAKAVMYAMSEMVRNTLEHSESRHGAVVAAQLYAGKATRNPYVSIAVVDSGVGVRKTIQRNYRVESHRDALLKAIEPGVTGSSRELYGASDNAGAGLFITRRFASATQHYFMLASGDAMFRTSIAKRKLRDEHLVKGISFYPGTIVSVEIGIQEGADFTEILSLAREAFGMKMNRRRDELSTRVKFR